MSEYFLAGYIIDIPENSKGELILEKGEPMEVKIPVYLFQDTPQKIKEKLAKIGATYISGRDNQK